ncbi:glycosyltransferase [soil metagenome]
MRISVIIPTFRRRDYLAKALRGLANQERKADQIVLGVREGDTDTMEFLSSSPLAHEIAPTTVPGVIASMGAALARTDGEVVCLLDDDAEPLPDWLLRIEQHFSQEPKLGILGGRDLLQDHPEMRRQESLLLKVGLFTWYGRILGNHHRGGGAYRQVDLVKGCNAAVRGPLLREIGFARHLRGQGAQVHWELALCLDVANRGFAVTYDPALQVIHHIAPRHDDDQIHRGKFSAEGLKDMIWNEHHVVVSRAGWLRSQAHLAWSMLVGSLTAPGLVQYLRLVLKKDPHRKERLATTFRAALAARRQRIS